ncbi:phenylalanine-tRNA chloroplastic mitochondrial [Micractinium conductrix]|uniref:phenylalanine--tRNA ligase n=1 Tax=Micractinium conductrix TaxID=554055 RepID=A0A2P6V293_9CHLO|nr:phenylalanine-tRNA chloroplastic mitochondrial [Micractinium conductrix]|eukprot:PSC68201.1 phenylalanine-tRNA chloroplastic mitochondrial [Micractinium conductrix]
MATLRVALAVAAPRCRVLAQRGLWTQSRQQLAAAAAANGVARPSRRGLTTVSQAAAAAVTTLSRDEVITGHPSNNVTDAIYSKIGVNLHLQPTHPIGIIKQAIYDYFDKQHPDTFKKFDNLAPIVSAHANFDEVLVPADHVSRSPNDTYYVDPDTVLRCHTSAHQAELLRGGHSAFLCTGDVYRRDSIDATHYPVFHQMEGVRVFSAADWAGQEPTAYAETELKRTLEGLAQHLFGKVEMRWIDAYFPFTEPSFELEIFFKGEWLEVLGCGVMQQQILDKNLEAGHKAWAFGLGLERLAMVLFDIPDIRLFWTADQRFLKQFRAGDLSARFKSYSKFPPCYKDVAFWVSDAFTENNLCEVVRGIAGDLAEEVKLIDTFTHPKTGRTSNCYRIAYRSMDRSLTDDEINALQEEVRSTIASKLGVELR